MKKFKRIYIEITNSCNLQCSFCNKSKRPKAFMSVSKFEHILKEIKPFTDVIYLHVSGEPLLHPKLDELLTLCEKYNLKVNITTNGTLITKNIPILNKHTCIKHLNISLHSENNNPNYCEEIFESINNLTSPITIIFRLWTLEDGKMNKKSTEVVDKIINYYQLSTEIVEKIKTDKNIKITNSIYLDKQELFEWPTLDNNFYDEVGYCQGLKTHLAILVDGTVVPCCLDAEGIVSLGNIFNTSCEEIINSKRTSQIIKSFQNRQSSEELCKHCSYKKRF